MVVSTLAAERANAKRERYIFCVNIWSDLEIMIVPFGPTGFARIYLEVSGAMEVKKRRERVENGENGRARERDRKAEEGRDGPPRAT